MSKRKSSESHNPYRASKLTSRQHVDSHNHFHIGVGALLETTVQQHTTVSRHQDRILAAAKRTPRFLLRTWYGQSGGSKTGQYNSTTAIIPRAFAEGRQPHLLFDMKQSEFFNIAARHVGRRDVDTVFSSWSQSLFVVL